MTNNSAPILRLGGRVPADDFELDTDAEHLQLQSEQTDPDFEVEIQKAKEGELMHFRRAGFIWQKASMSRLEGMVSRRGEQHTISKYDLENVDREQRGWLDLLHDPERQIGRWGFVMYAPGPTPADLGTYDPTNAADRDEERARLTASAALLSERERIEEMRRIHDELGRPSTSTTINSAEGQR